MNKAAFKIAKVNLQNIKAVYLTVGIIAGIMLFQVWLNIMLGFKENSNVSIGCILWLIPLIAAILIPVKNFPRIISLGGKRDNFIAGSLMVYILLAFTMSLANTAIYFTFDRFIQNGGYFSEGLLHGVLNLIEVFGWAKNGALVAFAQQFAFLFLVTVAIHTLASIQDRWYGWVTDVILIAIIAIFTPIAPLRAVLVWFFNLIIFQTNELLQIGTCLFIAIVICALNKPIFARKII